MAAADLHRMQAALVERDLEQAHACVTGVFTNHDIMLTIAYEWVLRWLAFAAERCPESVAPAAAVFGSSLSEDERAVAGQILALFEPQPEKPGEKERFLQAFPWIGQNAEAVMQDARQGEWDRAHGACERLFRLHRQLHDLLFRHSWALMSRMAADAGQAAAEEGLRRALTESSFYEFQWQMAEGKSPEEIAAMLVEHMKAHFSGPDGAGAVEVVEEPDSILLRFDPCGSGGAMRRRLGATPGFARLAEATPMTWSRAGEVPAYCAHCTINELEAVRRRGHLVWATEFDPDDSKPCGWRVFKDPSKIPAHYYQRLGLPPREPGH